MFPILMAVLQIWIRKSNSNFMVVLVIESEEILQGRKLFLQSLETCVLDFQIFLSVSSGIVSVLL